MKTVPTIKAAEVKAMVDRIEADANTAHREAYKATDNGSDPSVFWYWYDIAMSLHTAADALRKGA